MPAPQTHVVIVVDIAMRMWRDVAVGAATVLRHHDRPRLSINERFQPHEFALLRELRPQGIIAQVSSGRRVAGKDLAAIGCPVVNVSGVAFDHELPFPRVLCDPVAIARLAADHLRAQGFRRFHYHSNGVSYAVDRGIAFHDLLARAGLPCTGDPLAASLGQRRRQAVLDMLAAEADEPLGVFCCNDHEAMAVAEICAEMDVAMPERVAIVGVDDDDILSLRSPVPLTSITLPGKRIGEEAALLLLRLMAGASPPTSPILLPPEGIAVRASTSAIAVADPLVRSAMRAIRERHRERIDVEDIIAAVGAVGRRTLESRFRAAVGRTLGEELRRVRVASARELLRGTVMPVGRVAELCGFGSAEWFATAFRQVEGVSPLTYRRTRRPQTRYADGA